VGPCRHRPPQLHSSPNERRESLCAHTSSYSLDVSGNSKPITMKLSVPPSTEHSTSFGVVHLVEVGHQALPSVSILLKIPKTSTLYLPSLASSTSLTFLPPSLQRQLSEYLNCNSISFTLPEFLCRSATSTATASGVSSSNTSTTPTGTGAASLGADAQSGLLTAVTALVALIATLY